MVPLGYMDDQSGEGFNIFQNNISRSYTVKENVYRQRKCYTMICLFQSCTDMKLLLFNIFWHSLQQIVTGFIDLGVLVLPNEMYEKQGKSHLCFVNC